MSESEEFDDNAKSDLLTDEMRGDRTKALVFLFGRISKLNSDMAWDTRRASELLKEAQAAGHSPAVIRLTERISRMTPEDRRKWAEQQSAAAEFFGYEAMGVGAETTAADIADGARRELWTYSEKLAHLRLEKLEKAEYVKECYSAAQEIGIEPKALRMVVKLGTMDGPEREDYLGDVNEMVDTLTAAKAMRSGDDI